MKKKLLFIILLFLNIYTNAAIAANDLITVFQQALHSDPTYQQAIAQALSTEENVPISRSVLLPNLSFGAEPSITGVHNTGAIVRPLVPGGPPPILPQFSSRGLDMRLSLSQTVFNFAQYEAYVGAKATAKQATATLDAAYQNLILRVAQAYFNVLQDEDNLVYNQSNKEAYAKQLDQTNQQYKVGLKTLTDVYTARAAYDTAVASYIAAETQLANDKENLRAITGIYYPRLSKLKESFPLVSPKPANIEAWASKAREQNWTIKANEFAAQAAHENIKQQFAGHLPTVTASGLYDINATPGQTGLVPGEGSSKTRTGTLALSLNLPIFAGGGVVSETNQAQYNYQVAEQQLESNVRAAMTNARQSYLNIISGIRKIHADKQSIKSTMSSLEGLQEGYQVGTQTLVDVVNQQEKVFAAQTQYAQDRYAYVTNLLILKNAAGTLSQQDLLAINTWLTSGRAETKYSCAIKSKRHGHKQKKKSTPVTQQDKKPATTANNKKNMERTIHEVKHQLVNMVSLNTRKNNLYIADNEG